MKNNVLFGYFPFQRCVLALAFVFFQLALYMLLINMTDYKEYAIGFIMATICIFWIVVAWGFALFSTIKESYSAIFTSTVLWSIFVIFWFMLVLVAVSVGSTSEMIIHHRGPESLWMVYNVYNHDQYDVEYEYYEHFSHDREPGSVCINRLSSDETDVTPEDWPDVVVGAPQASSMETLDDISMRWTLIVVCFLLYSYLIFGSWYVLYRYCKQVRYKTLCTCPAICNNHETNV